VGRADLAAPDRFADPVTGGWADPGRCSFRVHQRSEAQVGKIK
jgi:hypothetical protein